MTLEQVKREAEEILKQHEITDAVLDSWYLMEYVTGMSRTDFLLYGKGIMPKAQFDKYQKLVQKRAERVPLQHLTEMQEFMGISFRTTDAALIPRQDTEVLTEQILLVCRDKSVLELGAGSGCILISLAKLGQIKSGTGVDVSLEALCLAKDNARSQKISLEWLESDMFSAVKGQYDIIVSNPPYIETAMIQNLQPEVRDHEPRMALDGGEDGLKFYRIIAKEAKNYLNDGGLLFLEIGCDQASKVTELLREAGFLDIKVVKDLAGLDRVIQCSTHC